MPELPEVETIRTGLARLLPAKRVTAIWHDWAKSFPNASEDIEQFLIGACVTGVRRRAKVLLIDLDTGYTLVIHLKMTGQLIYVKRLQVSQADATQGGNEQRTEAYRQYGEGAAELPRQQSMASASRVSSSAAEQAGTVRKLEERFGAGHPNESLIGDLPDKTTRVIFDFDDESKLFFNDQRKFGWVKLLPTQLINDALTGLVLEASARKQRAVEQAVQDSTAREPRSDDAAIAQEPTPSAKLSLIGGVGDTGAVIDFFRKVGPEPLAADFTAEQFRERIRRRTKTNIKAALLDQTVIAGVGNIYADESLWGAKIHPLTMAGSLSGHKLRTLFQELQRVLQLSIDKGGSTDKTYVDAEGRRGSYLSFASVFRKEGQPCPRCGNTIIKTRVAGRGTHTCPKCQKLPKG